MTVRNVREPSAVFPDATSDLGVRSLAREMTAVATSALSPASPLPENLPRGDGHTVIVLPGLLSGDWTTTRLRDVIAQLNYRVETPEMLFNTGPTRQVLAKLETTLAESARASGARVSLVGVSLGGVLARQLALDNPAAIRCIVTLCSPIRYPVITPLQPLAHALSPFHDRAWLNRRGEIGGPLPVPSTAVYSKEDGIVDWGQCLQDDVPGAVNVCVGGPHMTIGSNPDAQRAVAHALAESGR